jgi:chloramphenicol-sensitive protein RarD
MAIGAYLWWGFVALYFKQLAHVNPLEMVSHRVVWLVFLLLGIVAVTGGWSDLRRAIANRRTMSWLVAASVALSVNWYVFIYAITAKQLVQASLGYFMNPLVNVFFGLIFLRERMRPGQAAGMILAGIGVAYMTAEHGHIPLIAISLAVSFGLYGLFRKIAVVGPVSGLLIETTFMFPIALGIIFYSHLVGSASYSAGTWTLLVFSGVATAVPLLMFAAAVKRLRMMTIGFMQYIAPTCQFLLAVFAFNEPFDARDAISFGLIWTALLIYSIDSVIAYHRSRGITSANATQALAVDA